MSTSDYLRTKKLRKRSRGDGRVDVVGKDINGTEYTALTTDSSEVTHEDIAALDRGDPFKRSQGEHAKEFVDYFVGKQQENKAEYEAAMLKDYEEVMERDILPGAFKHSPRQCNGASMGTSVSIGGLAHPKRRCHFRDQGGCDWCY